MDTGIAAYEFVHASAADTGNDGLPPGDQAHVLSPPADPAPAHGIASTATAVGPGSNDSGPAGAGRGRHRTAYLAYIVAALGAVLLYLAA